MKTIDFITKGFFLGLVIFMGMVELSFADSEDIGIELIHHSSGERCVRPNWDNTTREDTLKPEVEVREDKVWVRSGAIRFNCCLAGIEKSLDHQQGTSTIKLVAEEYFDADNTPCRCLCNYQSEWFFTVKRPNQYKVIIQSKTAGGRIKDLTTLKIDVP